MTDAEKAAAARAYKRKRDMQDYTRAVSNIEWLSADAPKWACGSPVNRSDISNLLELNRNIVERLAFYKFTFPGD